MLKISTVLLRLSAFGSSWLWLAGSARSCSSLSRLKGNQPAWCLETTHTHTRTPWEPSRPACYIVCYYTSSLCSTVRTRIMLEVWVSCVHVHDESWHWHVYLPLRIVFFLWLLQPYMLDFAAGFLKICNAFFAVNYLNLRNRNRTK